MKTKYEAWSQFGRVLRNIHFKIAFFMLALILFLLSVYFQQNDSAAPKAIESKIINQSQVVNTFENIPMRFELNQGQTDDQVKFLSRGKGYTLFLTSSDTVLTLEQKPVDKSLESMKTDSETPLHMQLVGANPKPKVEGLVELITKSNYLIGNDPAKWRKNIPNYEKVRFSEIYPGIDLVYYGINGELEYDFNVFPGINPKIITLRFDKETDVQLDENGDLILQVGIDSVIMQAPLAYQEFEGTRTQVAAEYIPRDERTFGFEVGEYDESMTLVIDPVIEYSTFLGDYMSAEDIAVDKDGFVYVTGNAFGDVFVTKLHPDSTEIMYTTLLGGDLEDFGLGIAVDTAGNVYVTGETYSDNFPSENAIQPDFGGDLWVDGDAFVTKLKKDGSSFIYSTYLGGANVDIAYDIAVDFDGNAYVIGETQGNGFPLEKAMNNVETGWTNAFVSKINSDGSAFIFSTYFGGSTDDEGHGIAVDSDQNIYITGSTWSSDFPTSENAYQKAALSGLDAFVTKLKPDGSDYIYSTYLTGTNNDVNATHNDQGTSIAVDNIGQVYVAGVTSSPEFPTKPQNVIQPNFGGVSDAFVTKFTADGSDLIFSTYLGGNEGESWVGVEIALDSDGNAVVTGVTESTNFPREIPVLNTLNGPSDAFVTVISSDGLKLLFSSYLGGSSYDEAKGIAVANNGHIFITGRTSSQDFPLESPLAGNGGNGYGFVTEIGFAGLALTGLADNPIIKAGELTAINARIIDGSTGSIAENINGNAILKILDDKSTTGIGRLTATSATVTNGIVQPVFLETPAVLFASDKPITPQTVLSGKATIEIRLENIDIPPIEVKVEVKSPFDFFIEKIEIQQGIVKSDEPVTLEFKPGENKNYDPLNFIAEHQTVARVFVGYKNTTAIPFTIIEGITGISSDLTISFENDEITGIFDESDFMIDEIQYVLKDKENGVADGKVTPEDYENWEQGDLRDALTVRILPEVVKKPGAYTFDAQLKFLSDLDEIESEKQNDKSVTKQFVGTKPLRILTALGTIVNYPFPKDSEVTEDVLNFLKNAYPIQESKLTFTDPTERHYRFKKKPGGYKISGGAFFIKMSLYRHLHNLENPNDQRDRILIFGGSTLLIEICGDGGGGCTKPPLSSAIVKAEKEKGQTGSTIAHELGHTFSLWDTYENGRTYPWAPNPRRSDAQKNGNIVEEGNISFGPETMRKAISGDDPIYDFMSNKILDYDNWVDRATWDHLYKNLQTDDNPKLETNGQNDFIFVSGIIDTNDQVTLSPFLILPNVTEISTPRPGEYTLEFLDSQDMVLNAIAFDVLFTLPEVGDVTETAFAFDFPFPENTAVVSVKKNGTEIASRTFSENPPVIELTSPTTGETIEDVTTLTWTASDPDGDQLIYSILYSPDGQEEIVVDVGIAETSYEWDSRLFAESTSASITIIANDGINEAKAISNDLVVVSVAEDKKTVIPTNFELQQNYPNPFNPSTTIKYSIPIQSNVTLKVFDVLGKEVVTLVKKEQSQGNYEIEFDGKDLTSGIYFYRLKVGEFVETKKMLVMK
jgi:Beta-propeller repeat/Secretion system C-terminal sorting domain